LASAFVGAAGRYWLGVFPHINREVRHWQRRAGEIPDPALRRLALLTQCSERGNLEGAAAFAVLAPRAHRARVVRAVIAFQATYDYVDTLAEQPSADPVTNGQQLHLALLTALTPETEHPNYYYAHESEGCDDGYMRNLIDTCRSTLRALPSYASVAEPALKAAKRMVTYQSFNHDNSGGQQRALARWASALTPPGTGLRWWETAAAGASSLSVFALIAAAAQPSLSVGETIAIEDAYFPWIGALHVLLDSLIDRGEDLDAGHHSLVEHYASSQEAASRLSAIAARSMQATEALPAPSQHAVIVAAMTSFYLCAHRGSIPAQLAARQIGETMGALTTPTRVVFGARRAAERLRAAASARAASAAAATASET
jgi:tetraprenyl-beta-curcumene synthase